MGGPAWPPSRFWQYWALAGMLVLTAAFWWGVEGYALFASPWPRGQIADGLLRFTLLVLTPALVLAWLAAGWLRRRVGETGYWQLLGIVAMIWAGGVLVTRMLVT
ncbi:hypothetical protein [Sphingopyxis macrogoltabida]|uniref:Uncharacterized protein n=1 Tax=Sphingopyxis macrogoltabida TaxID=33050 RepID=A0A0N7GRU7_SPHMC|nr:hypothetical protein [Sphingopyxis macrogoltabida]ALH78907.1 hypothetical protein AN936_00515 [Sphingopyxis macrogoltabida]